MGIAISWSPETQETVCVPSLELPLVPVPRLLFAIPSAPAQVSLAESQSKLVSHSWHNQFPNVQFLSCRMEAMCLRVLRVWCVTLLTRLGSIARCQLRQTWSYKGLMYGWAL